RGFGACLIDVFFFFSSRRRHTRLQGDWSSDVCSSDLVAWRSPQVEQWRARWSRADWLGAIGLAVGVVILVSAYMGNQSHEWLVRSEERRVGKECRSRGLGAR